MAAGFFEQKPASPLSFGAVLMLHGAVIAAVVLLKGPGFTRVDDGPLTVIQVPIDKPPPPIPPTDEPQPQKPTISRYDVPKPVVRPIPSNVPSEPILGYSTPDIGSARPLPDIPVARPLPEPRLVEVPPRRPTPAVRVEAQFDPRFAGAMQPPYPSSEVRAEREGMVRIRVTIAASGRVTAVQQLSATSAAFFQATERQALSRWRFKPATLDGRPVESSKVMNVRFQLDGR